MTKPAPELHSTVREPLERKLMLALCIAALVFSGVAGALQFTYSYLQELQRSRIAIDNLAATVHSSASIAAFVGNDAIANDVIDGLLRNPEIVAVGIESKNSYRILRWKNAVAPTWNNADAMSYPLLSPIGAHAPIGTLRILTDARFISTHARNAALVQLGTLIAQTAVIALIMLFAFRRLIGRPLDTLTRQLHTVTPGNSQRIDIGPTQAHTEIGLLAGSLNHYLAASEQAIHAERELRLRVESMENHYRRIFESTNIGIMLLNPDGSLVNGNTVLHERILRTGFDTDTADRHGDFLAFAFKHPDKAWTLIERARSNKRIEESDLELRHDNGLRHWVHCLFSIHTPEHAENGAYFIECVLFDVTSRREREQMAIRSAERDALTDLINRRGAETYLDRAIREACQAHNSITAFYIDLDGFKIANDKYGHAAGDQVLIEVAARFGCIMRRSSDLLARIGGDEFLFVAHDCDKHAAVVRELAEKLIEALIPPITLSDGRSAHVGASIGIAGFPQDGSDQETLLQAADRAMYVAKHTGKNRYVYAAGTPPAPEAQPPD